MVYNVLSDLILPPSLSFPHLLSPPCPFRHVIFHTAPAAPPACSLLHAMLFPRIFQRLAPTKITYSRVFRSFTTADTNQLYFCLVPAINHFLYFLHTT